MDKKIIRLTESDLHNIVKESVNKILTELDWKTLANAEKKARGVMGDVDYWREKGVKGFDAVRNAGHQRERAKRFGDAAKDAFKDLIKLSSNAFVPSGSIVHTHKSSYRC